MGKVETELAGLIDRRIKRALKEALGDMPKQIAQLQKDLAALAASTSGNAAAAVAAVAEPAPKIRFSKRTISTLRKKLKVSRKELAAQLGVSAFTIASWETGKSKPRAAALAKIAALRAGKTAPAEKPAKPEPKPVKKAKKATKAKKSKKAPKTPKAKPVKEVAPVKAAAPKKAAKKMGARTVKKLRNALGLSQSAFAKKLGVSANSVSNWETGHSAPRGDSLDKLNELKQ